MTGAILGDIAGSRFEFSKPSGFNYKKVKLFGNNCFFTDDTVLTIATKYALLNDISYAKAYGKFGRMYRDVGYGTMFQRWLDGHAETGYGALATARPCASVTSLTTLIRWKRWRKKRKTAPCAHTTT